MPRDMARKAAFLQRSEERERGLVAGVGTCCSKEEVLWGMDSTLGLGAKGGAGILSVWTVKESGGIERLGGWAEPRAREVNKVKGGCQERERKNNGLCRKGEMREGEDRYALDSVPSVWPSTEPQSLLQPPVSPSLTLSLDMG